MKFRPAFKGGMESLLPVLDAVRIRSLILTAMAAVGVLCHAQAASIHGGVVSGIVRDVSGAPQTGALVQIFTPDASLIASAITDLRGRYRISNLHAGSYRVRATAALFLPAQREGLQVKNGSRAVVDLTLSTLFSLSDWLPAQRRKADEPGDDWMWTLRSSANRPILRMADDDNDSNVAISTSGREARRGASATAGRVVMTSDDNAFAHGGVHQTFTLDRMQADGSTQMIRASFSGPRTPYPVAPSADITTGMQSRSGMNGYSRVMVSYHSHPELVGAGGTVGMQAATVRSAQRIELGDTFVVDGGSMLQDVNMGGNAVTMLPFVSISIKPAQNVILTYGYATTPEMQSLDDLDRVQVEVPVAYTVDGHLQTEKSSHQSFGASAHSGHTVVEFAVYHDHIRNGRVGGIGVLTGSELQTSNAVADPTTQSFRALARGFESTGYEVSVSQKLTPTLTLSGQIASGAALTARCGSANADLPLILASMRPEQAYAATVSLAGKLVHSGTRLRASYRWQPDGTLTAVDSFKSYGDAAFFSVHLRQPLRIRGVLPDGLEAVVDVTNLLAEGYQPFVSSDGRTLYLAQAPRTLQAGLAFTF